MSLCTNSNAFQGMRWWFVKGELQIFNYSVAPDSKVFHNNRNSISLENFFMYEE